MNGKWFYVLTGFGGAIAIAIIAGLAIVWSGSYSIAATDGHSGLTRWLFHTTMENSVRSRAPEAPVIEATDASIAAGAGEYKVMCQTCHGGPGAESAIWARDLEPEPPDLGHAAEEWDEGEIYWIVRNGVKMTGMPAFGPTHDEETLRNIAAFVERLPGMSAEEYAAFGAAAGHGDTSEAGGDDHGTEGHSH
ncbi:MAG: cytochrome c [Parasphingopyxis sp.]|uniref:c-type cytochrome n=1 Tax=Parasphingopyxis sp. TaxID=1920299 RepID=UPI0032EDFD5B